jgi:hypothetical protein
MLIDDKQRQVCTAGSKAWVRLKKNKTWSDWLAVGAALQVGREWAMRSAGVNKPEGKGYNQCFGEWLTEYGLDDMDKGDRSRLFNVMDNLPAIEEYRKTLTTTERLKLNHPSTVWRKWKSSQEPEPRDHNGQPKPTLRDSVANLSEEVHAKKREVDGLLAHIADLEAAPCPHCGRYREEEVVADDETDTAPKKRGKDIVLPDAETTLQWVEDGTVKAGDNTYKRFKAAHGDGHVEIGVSQSFPSMRFNGYDVCYWAPGGAVETMPRIGRARTLDKAKKLAEQRIKREPSLDAELAENQRLQDERRQKQNPAG